jgi:hypothetical protein
MRYTKIPECALEVNTKLAPQLKKYQYRGFLSTEIRKTEDGHAYLIDPCARMGSPPGELYQIIVENLAEVIWYGAEGLLVDPEFAGMWGAELILTSEALADSWVKVTFPEEYLENVKLRYYTEHEGGYYVIPQANRMPYMGAVVAYGDTAKAAIDKCREIAETIDAFDMGSKGEALDVALKDLKAIISPEKPATREQTVAEGARKAGKISQRQFERMAETNGW